MTRRMARNLGALAAGETYDEAGGNPDPTTAAQMVASGNVYGTPVTGPVSNPVAFAQAAYANQFKTDGKSKTMLVLGAVAIGLLLFGGLGKKH